MRRDPRAESAGAMQCARSSLRSQAAAEVDVVNFPPFRRCPGILSSLGDQHIRGVCIGGDHHHPVYLVFH